ncbi:hypothetical protein C8R44DRAFT_886371 [Mycena epipterygia]|nr:hypothetical protein C8R44DRAFT_886371 [Mycena epipterygia]
MGPNKLVTHNISEPADVFLQAVVTAETRLTAIAVSLPPFMVHDKILAGLSSVYSPIIAVLQNESPQRAVPDMIAAINAWERADLQKCDSVIKTARSMEPNHGGEPEVLLARGRPRHSDQNLVSPSQHSRSAAGMEFDWTNTKNWTDVCFRCGVSGHFAQYCVSIMPDDVRRRILRDRAQRAHLAEGPGDLDSAGVATEHAMQAVLDLPDELHIDTMDPGTLVMPGFPSSPITSYLSPILLTISSTPTKTKKKSKKKATVKDVQSAFEGLSLAEKEEEDEFSI